MIIGRRRFAGSALATILLSGCVTTGRNWQFSDAVPLETLIRQIKHDVGLYIVETQGQQKQIATPERPCAGDVNFSISSVKISVTATFERGSEVSGGLKVPIKLVELAGGANASRSRKDTITTELTIYPITPDDAASYTGDAAELRFQKLDKAPPQPREFSGTPIRDALTGLRRDLVAASDVAPCFDFGQGTQSNVVKWGFEIVEKAGLDAGFSILVFSIGAKENASRTYANTIEVGFIASGIGAG